MEDNPLIAAIRIVCVLLAVRGAASVLKRRLGQRDIGLAGGVAMVPISFALMWLASRFVSSDSYYWFAAIAACTGTGVLISMFLFGKPRDSSERLS